MNAIIAKQLNVKFRLQLMNYQDKLSTLYNRIAPKWEQRLAYASGG